MAAMMMMGGEACRELEEAVFGNFLSSSSGTNPGDEIDLLWKRWGNRVENAAFPFSGS